MAALSGLLFGSDTAPLPAPAPRETRSPHSEAGFLMRVVPKERRYAELGYLLPFYLGPAVKTRCVGPSSWLASYLQASMVSEFQPCPKWRGGA